MPTRYTMPRAYARQKHGNTGSATTNDTRLLSILTSHVEIFTLHTLGMATRGVLGGDTPSLIEKMRLAGYRDFIFSDLIIDTIPDISKVRRRRPVLLLCLYLYAL